MAKVDLYLRGTDILRFFENRNLSKNKVEHLRFEPETIWSWDQSYTTTLNFQHVFDNIMKVSVYRWEKMESIDIILYKI